ncbi:MAG: hypothetical protein GXC76_16785 [Rhodanobacteraceae bacterium]|nr:hypothetical protein [Rhodanobacteraceae bacterium]
MKRLVKVASFLTAALVLLIAAAIAVRLGFSLEAACENTVIYKIESGSLVFRVVDDPPMLRQPGA